MEKGAQKKVTGLLIFTGILIMAITSARFEGSDLVSITWHIDNTERIADTTTIKLGDPVVIETSDGPAIEFDGVDDGLIVEDNPLAGAEEFTVEVIFKPYPASLSTNTEQRFIHIQESDNKRILIELRLADNNQWFLDTFIKDGDSNCTLYADTFLHPIGAWYRAALVYNDGIMRHYVNGEEELSGDIQYSKMLTGQTSIGVRLNKRSWYKGAIRLLRITNQALDPKDFLPVVTAIIRDKDGKGIVKTDQFSNFPNPVKAQTTILYPVPKTGMVKLAVYDAVGHLVSKLVEKNESAGIYSVKFDATLLPSGVYFYRLETEAGTLTRKLLLIR